MFATEHAPLRLPEGFRKKLGDVAARRDVYQLLRKSKLNTVCEEARCPNIGECFSNNTATFMILGDRCTRRCHFCSVKTGKPAAPEWMEPQNLVDTARDLALDHVVITSVDRDDLNDLGAGHFARCIDALKTQIQDVKVELLTPDFKGREDLIDRVLDAKPDVFGHNIETVERLYRQVRPQSHFNVTSSVLKYVASTKRCEVKSGMMVGLGESDDEVSQTLVWLKELGVQVVTIGQYLRPSMKHWPVSRYVQPESYQRWIGEGQTLGFKHVFAGPFVRSSYHAKETHLSTSTSTLLA
jgi:lipoic acid synthetase